jgi:hypothetical protein
MNTARFEPLVRSLHQARSRRGALAVLLSGPLGLLHRTETTAKHKKKHKKKRPSAVPATPYDVHAADASISINDRWTGSGVRSIRVIDCLQSDWHGALRAAVSTWNARFPYAVLTVDESAVCPQAMQDGAIVASSVHAYAAWHGTTTMLWDADGAITAAFIQADEADYEGHYPWPQVPAREALMCHEIGHALGAPHTNNGTGGCMAVDGNLSDTFPSDWTITDLSSRYATTPTPTPGAGQGKSKSKGKHKGGGKKGGKHHVGRH